MKIHRVLCLCSSSLLPLGVHGISVFRTGGILPPTDAAPTVGMQPGELPPSVEASERPSIRSTMLEMEDKQEVRGFYVSSLTCGVGPFFDQGQRRFNFQWGF